MTKLTKILATIGPCTQPIEMINGLLDAGMNAVRLNFSHGDHVYHGQTITNVRQIEQDRGLIIPIILDTKGPEIRTGVLLDGKAISLVEGAQIMVTSDDVVGSVDLLQVNYATLYDDTVVGGSIMICDGLLELRIIEKLANRTLLCSIVNGGELGQKKNVNLPGVIVNLPALADKDKEDLIFGCQQNVDYIAASFIRKPEDVQEVRAFLDANGGKYIKIISKIENQEGVDKFHAILELTDGVMVARGDLGVDVPTEYMPSIQKMMIAKCNAAGKLVVTATQMLDSMIKNPRPTRAEATDVANAVLDGTDAVMLSGETANGSYPIQSVAMMARICATTEQSGMIRNFEIQKNISDTVCDLTHAVALGAVDIAHTLHAACVIAASVAGTTVRALRQHNPSMPIIAITPYMQSARQMQLIKGVHACQHDAIDSYETLYTDAKQYALDTGYAMSGDTIVITGGGSIGQIGVTDMVKVMKV